MPNIVLRRKIRKTNIFNMSSAELAQGVVRVNQMCRNVPDESDYGAGAQTDLFFDGDRPCPRKNILFFVCFTFTFMLYDEI